MRIIILFLSIITLFSSSVFAKPDQDYKKSIVSNEKLCSLFKDKIQKYQKKLEDRSDLYAVKTMESYKKRADIYCKIIKEE